MPHGSGLPGGARELTRDDPTSATSPPAFGPFRVLHQIGVGVLGPVFRTYEPQRDRLVAVKVFRLDITPEQARALAAELDKIAEMGLFHPSIVAPIGAGVEGTMAYLAQEYVAAESLDVALRHYAPAALDKALPYVTQLAGAIDFARAAGVSHGALHPRDVFVTPDEARATGFGIASALQSVGVRPPVRRPYSAPERIAGGEWGTPADVFSLAAITFELLTGRRIVGEGDEAVALLGDLSDGVDAEAVRSVLAAALATDPAARPPSALAFAAALEAALGRQSSAAQHAPLQPRLSEDDRSGRLPPSPEASADRHSLGGGGQPSSFADDDEARLTAGTTPAPAAPRRRRPPRSETAAAAQPAPDVVEDRPLFETLAETPVMEAALSPSGDEDPLLGVPEPSATVSPTPDDSRAQVQPGPSEEGRGPWLQPGVSEDDRSARLQPSPSAEQTDEAHLTVGTPHALQRGRPAVAAIAATLMVGLVAGFLAGYAVGARGRPAPSSAPASAAGPQEPRSGVPSSGALSPRLQGGPADARRAEAGREWSEGAVTEPSSGQRESPAGAQPLAAPPPEIAANARSGAAGAAPAKPAPSAPGRMLVRSSPAGAEVALDGHARGVTPLAVRDLAYGTYTVRVTRSGYRPESRRVTVSARRPAASLTIDLRRDVAPAATTGQFFGSLYIDSRPRGARVLVDGRVFGTTPLVISELRAGSHVVRLEQQGYNAWSSSVQVVAGERGRVTASLERTR